MRKSTLAVIAIAFILGASAAQAGAGLLAGFKWHPYSVDCGPDPIAFTDTSTSGSTTITSWSWDFGDTASSTDASPVHSYASPGTYNVTLIVASDDGESSSISMLVSTSAHDACVEHPTGDAPATPPPGDGVDEEAGTGDLDQDGVANAADDCPSVPDSDQIDSDKDGHGDACDLDLDADGVPNMVDGCPTVADASQTNLDGDGFGDACDLDADGDLVPDAVDNCPRAANAKQLDTDGDGEGDACDVGAPGLSSAPRAPGPLAMTRGAGSIATTATGSSAWVAAAAIAAAAVTGSVVVSWRRLAQRAAMSIPGAAKFGLGVGAAGLFTRIAQDELLDHPGRRRIMDCIRDHPGIHLGALQRAVGAEARSVQYHLKMLTKAGLVRRHQWRGSVGYYAEGVTPQAAHVSLRSETARSILAKIVVNPGATANDIAGLLDCDPSLVAYHLRQFQGAGLIDRVTQSGAQRILPRPEAGVILAQL